MNLEVGSVVLSKKGRDKGNYFLVMSLNGERLTIADGDKHRIAAAKVKNIKHVKLINNSLPHIATKLVEGKKVFDSEINSALRCYNQQSIEE